ncbi:MAG: hypothetical protein RR857_12550 [Comamonas sp.]
MCEPISPNAIFRARANDQAGLLVAMSLGELSQALGGVSADAIAFDMISATHGVHMPRIMTILAVIGILAAAFVAWRYGVF